MKNEYEVTDLERRFIRREYINEYLHHCFTFGLTWKLSDCIGYVRTCERLDELMGV